MIFDPATLGALRKDVTLAAPPPIPAHTWRPPVTLPDLRGASLMAFDVETKDLELLEAGPGWGRGRGHIVGFSLAAIFPDRSRWKGYVPIRHEVQREYNRDPGEALRWAKAMLETPMPKVGANLLYDVGWFTEEGVYPQGKLYDLQFAAALLDENAPVNLEHLASEYLGRGKTSAELYEWCARAYGGKANDRQRRNIYRSPPSIVGPYGEDDSDLCLDILPMQWRELYQQDLLHVFDLETRLIPLLVLMRRQGVKVDLNYAEELYYSLAKDIEEAEAQFKHKHGIGANVNSGGDLAKVFDHLGLKYNKTASGNPSFQKDYLKNLEHPVGQDINDIRELIKIRSTFVKGYILEKNIRGSLHCQFHPLKGDDGGAKTGRFASSDPNLQNIPVRSKVGKKIRRAFVPRYRKWRKSDYSQIEYRFLAHFAVNPRGGTAADDLRASYVNDPRTDYHDAVYYRVCPYMGWNPEDSELKAFWRRPIKNTNFGLVYGQGIAKLARTLGLSPQQAKEFFEAFFAGAPYVKPTMEAFSEEVQRNGYITTILGRRTRFELWEPIARAEKGEERFALPFNEALSLWGSALRRAYDYRGINYRLQGSSADQMKTAMVTCFESGVFNTTGYPLLTVHDELDFDVFDDSPLQQEAYRFIDYTMETCLPLRVPVVVDSKEGANWGAID